MENTERVKPVLDVEEKPKLDQWLTLSLQHLFAMFGATVLVPMLVGLSPAVALISSGLGTLAYLLITKGQIPAYLGSSFAFIVPIITATQLGGPGAAMLGAFFAGLAYGLVALLIYKFGVSWLMRILPPVVVGPVIIVIGLGLAGTAVNMAMYENPLAENPADFVYSGTHIAVALITLAITVIASIYFKKIFGLIPILIGISGGYIAALFAGLVDFQQVIDAPWFAVPDLFIPFVDYTPAFSWTGIIIMVPIAIVTLSEHTGHQMVVSKVVGRNFLEKPGLHRSILGDGVATMIAAMIGGPPNTTYGENIGVLAITRIFSVFVIGGAAVLAILFGFVGKISALISSIPTPVMGGVSILLFGIIASSGLRMLIEAKVDFSHKRNLIIASVIMIIGVGGAYVQFTETFVLPGMALAAIIGIALNLILPGRRKEEETLFNEKNKAA
ncbi:solute carrier family 23 protein [Jeotgalibacillus aurantiacus]|uniref:solute carrier family 23 protein n=1 Tax=Jeotgalibacillus aurantiacus TaxID=2763266 RepID=UPI001D09D448|nr:solute carrier family 23 protein [Jeotgalibacillus aurantiacus]